MKFNSVFVWNLLLVLLTMGVSFHARAEDDEVSDKARARAYPGGKDEDRIVVQTVLPEPEKKYTDKAIQNQVIKRPSKTD